MKVSNYKPTENYVLVEKPNLEETKGGILIPEELQEKMLRDSKNMTWHKVVAIGPDTKGISVGDEILFQGNGVILTFDLEDGTEQDHIQIKEYIVLGKKIYNHL